MLWTDLFPLPSSTESSTAAAPVSPRLGINFVQASAPAALIPILINTSSSDGLQYESATPAAMTIQQNLSQYGIAGVVWNCVRTCSLTSRACTDCVLTVLSLCDLRQARALIFHLQRQPHLLAKKRVLELGAGTGAVGLALVLSGCDLKSLILTDLVSVVPLTTQNVHFVACEHVQIRSMVNRNALSTLAYCWFVPLVACSFDLL